MAFCASLRSRSSRSLRRDSSSESTVHFAGSATRTETLDAECGKGLVAAVEPVVSSLFALPKSEENSRGGLSAIPFLSLEASSSFARIPARLFPRVAGVFSRRLLPPVLLFLGNIVHLVLRYNGSRYRFVYNSGRVVLSGSSIATAWEILRPSVHQHHWRGVPN